MVFEHQGGGSAYPYLDLKKDLSFEYSIEKCHIGLIYRTTFINSVWTLVLTGGTVWKRRTETIIVGWKLFSNIFSIFFY